MHGDVVREWRCGCGTHNYSDKAHCRKCGAQRQANCSWRRPEWVCSCCKKNYTERDDCRECRQLRQAPGSGVAAPSAGANAAVLAPAAAHRALGRLRGSKVKQLEQQVEALRQLGASQATIDAVKAEVVEARRQHVSAKPLGARMDSAAGRVERARKRLAAANAAVDDALHRQEDALAEEADAVAELAALATEAANADVRAAVQPGCAVDSALWLSRELMEELERHCLGSGAPPEEIVSKMHTLREVLQRAQPEDPIDSDLDKGRGAESEGGDGEEAGCADGDDDMPDWGRGTATPQVFGPCIGASANPSVGPMPPASPPEPAPVSPAQARAAMRAMGIDEADISGDLETAKRKLDELAAIAARGPRHGTPGGRPPAKRVTH